MSLLVLSTGVGVVAGEIALRMLDVRLNGSTFVADPLLGWALRPNARSWEAEEGLAWTRINSHGYRDRERPTDKPRDTYRIAVIGDSLTEARQVSIEETFTAVAEDWSNRRRRRGEPTVEVLNFGVPGYGTVQELLLLRERVWAFSPDLIVLQVYSGNDIFNNHRALNLTAADSAPYFVLREGRLVLDDSFRHGRTFNSAYITLKSTAADMMNRSLVLLSLYKASRLAGQRSRLNTSGNRNELPLDYQRFLAFLPPSIPPMIEAWDVTEALIAQVATEVQAHRVPLLFVIVPTTHQIHPDPEVQRAYRAKYSIESLEYADDRVERQVRAIGLPVLRLAPALIAEARRTGRYMVGFANTGPNEGHLNQHGHAVVARELIEAIRRVRGW